MLAFERKISILTELKFPAQEVPEAQEPEKDYAREEYERVVKAAIYRPVFFYPGKESEDEMYCLFGSQIIPYDDAKHVGERGANNVESWKIAVAKAQILSEVRRRTSDKIS